MIFQQWIYSLDLSRYSIWWIFFFRTVFNTFNENFPLRYSSLTTSARVHLNKLSMRLEISIWEVLCAYDFLGIFSASASTLNFSQQLQRNKNLVSNFHIIQTANTITHIGLEKSMSFSVMCWNNRMIGKQNDTIHKSTRLVLKYYARVRISTRSVQVRIKIFFKRFAFTRRNFRVLFLELVRHCIIIAIQTCNS